MMVVLFAICVSFSGLVGVGERPLVRMALHRIARRSLHPPVLAGALEGIDHLLHDLVFGMRRAVVINPVTLEHNAVLVKLVEKSVGVLLLQADPETQPELAHPAPSGFVRLERVWRILRVASF